MMSGRKRAQCRICSKFFRADYLERHMETHRKSEVGNNDPRWFERLANMISEMCSIGEFFNILVSYSAY